MTKSYPNNPFYIIEELIIYKVLYYYNDPEYFCTIPDNAELSDDKLTVMAKKRGYTSCFGKSIIPSISKTIHCWKFYVENPGYSCCGIGIAEAPGKCEDADFYKIDQKNKTNYAYENSGLKYSTIDNEIAQDYGTTYSINSTIEMILNLVDGTLSFSLNGEDQGICYKVKQQNELNYVMAVSMYLYQQKITLLSYSNK